MHALGKYLRNWAEPESALADFVSRHYDRVLVVPATGEGTAFLDGYARAVLAASGRTLTILVVNCSEEASADVVARNAALLAVTRDRLHGICDLPRGSFLGCSLSARWDVLVVDRTAPGQRLGKKEGVGTARKIGTDLALALWARGQVASRFIFGTDADATLPEGYFEVSRLAESEREVSAVVIPFWHDANADADVTAATALYELSLRYYVAGLHSARSPYAFHSVGSSMAVGAEHYAQVRGFPRRAAGEDFYLLSKLAKVGCIARPASDPIRLQSRRSDRVPFGTGAAVGQILRGQGRGFYAPECFTVLADVVAGLEAFAEHGDPARFMDGMSHVRLGAGRIVRSVFEHFGAEDAFGAITRDASTAVSRRSRAHTWFDAFRTLKVVHALTDSAFPRVPAAAALRTAEFAPVRSLSGAADYLGERRAFLEQEESSEPFLGATRSRSLAR